MTDAVPRRNQQVRRTSRETCAQDQRRTVPGVVAEGDDGDAVPNL